MDEQTHRSHTHTHLGPGFLGELSEPVSNHREDGGEVRQSEDDPQPDQGLVHRDEVPLVI